MKTRRPILVVDDDKIDVMTIERALKEIKVSNRIETASNGEEALSILRSPAHEHPCLILLDLNMPKMNGLEFLKEFKQDENLKKIPVVILTTSREERDKVESFNNGIAGYMVKPVDYKQFVDVMKTIDLYWSLSEFPE